MPPPSVLSQSESPLAAPRAVPLRTAAAATQLPFDIIHALLDFASIPDLVHLCSTCRTLHAHLAVDSVWKRACAAYGVRDLSRFGARSPADVYAHLLHPYGPLLGLWANDHPFRGNVLEFRLVPGDEHEQAGIVGEVWRFPAPTRPGPGFGAPPPPLDLLGSLRYVRALKISFDPLRADGDPPAGVTSPRARVFCTPGAVSTHHLASLLRLHGRKLRHQLRIHRRQPVNLPEFPPYTAAWLDLDPTSSHLVPATAGAGGRRAPCILVTNEPAPDQRKLADIFPAARLPAVCAYPAPDFPAVALPSIVIRCDSADRCACAALHTPSIPYPALDPPPPRYYALRSTARKLVDPSLLDPANPAWSPDALEGIWIGDYGPHGFEVLYLWRQTESATRRVVATKITGDAHVPRGEASWYLENPERQDPLRKSELRGMWAALEAEMKFPLSS